jgi:hypothetical protein
MWTVQKQTSFDVNWWTPDKLEGALTILSKSDSWEIATNRFDEIFNTNYSVTASKRIRDGEYRSAFKKKFEYMPEIEWLDSETDVALVNQVIEAMKMEKIRRGGEARFDK